MKHVIGVGLVASLLAVCGAAQSPPQPSASSAAAARRRVLVDGKPIAGNRVIVKDTVTYVDVAALAGAMGATVRSTPGTVLVTTSAATCECDKAIAEGQRFSKTFRSDDAGVADEIESLRAVVMKKDKVPLGPRFDAIDRKLTLATAHVQTDADIDSMTMSAPTPEYSWWR